MRKSISMHKEIVDYKESIRDINRNLKKLNKKNLSIMMSWIMDNPYEYPTLEEYSESFKELDKSSPWTKESNTEGGIFFLWEYQRGKFNQRINLKQNSLKSKDSPETPEKCISSEMCKTSEIPELTETHKNAENSRDVLAKLNLANSNQEDINKEKLNQDKHNKNQINQDISDMDKSEDSPENAGNHRESPEVTSNANANANDQYRITNSNDKMSNDNDQCLTTKEQNLNTNVNDPGQIDPDLSNIIQEFSDMEDQEIDKVFEENLKTVIRTLFERRGQELKSYDYDPDKIKAKRYAYVGFIHELQFRLSQYGHRIKDREETMIKQYFDGYLLAKKNKQYFHEQELSNVTKTYG